MNLSCFYFSKGLTIIVLFWISYIMVMAQYPKFQTYEQYYTPMIGFNPYHEQGWINEATYNYQYKLRPVHNKEGDATFISYKPNTVYDHLQIASEQTYILPQDEGHAIVALNLIASNIDQLSVVLSTLNEQENIIQQQQYRFVPTLQSKTYNCSIDISGGRLLRVSLYLRGEKKKEGQILMHPTLIYVDGHSIMQASVPQTTIIPIKNYTATPNTLIPFQQFPSQARIIGFGESVHHNPTLQKAIYHNLLQLIKSKQSRLILIERYSALALALQYFIHHPEYKLYYPIEAIEQEFLDSLRIINQNRSDKEKVEIAGLDINYIHNEGQGTLIDIYDFLTSIPNWRKQQFCYPLIIALAEQKHKAALQAYQEHQTLFEQWLSPLLAKKIERYIQQDEMLPKDYTCFTKRDSVMAENVTWLMQQVSSPRTLLYMHAQHISKGSCTPIPNSTPMGNYLVQKYGEQYQPLLVTYGTGDGSLLKDTLVSKEGLAIPPIDSFEGQTLLLPYTSVYVPFDNTFNHIQKARFRATPFLSHCFFPMNLYRRFSGALFVRDCPFIPYITSSLEERLQAYEESIKRRKATVKQLRRFDSGRRLTR